MKTIYEKFKGRGVEFNNQYSGILVGYNDSFLILATRDTPAVSFKKLDKSAFVESDFKSECWSYVYCSESYVEKYGKAVDV